MENTIATIFSYLNIKKETCSVFIHSNYELNELPVYFNFLGFLCYSYFVLSCRKTETFP